MHIVIVTFDDGGETDTEVFGPFDTLAQANWWTDKFCEWWASVVTPRSRQLTRMHQTPIQSWDQGPWMGTVEPDDGDAGELLADSCR